MAGGPVEVAEALPRVFGAQRVGGAPGGGLDHPQQRFGEPWWLALADQSAEGSFGVPRGGVDEDAVLVLFGAGVDPFAQARRRVAGLEGQLADHEVGQGVQQDEARGEFRTGHVLQSVLLEGAVEVGPHALDASAYLRVLLPVLQLALVEGEENALAEDLDGRQPLQPARGVDGNDGGVRGNPGEAGQGTDLTEPVGEDDASEAARETGPGFVGLACQAERGLAQGEVTGGGRGGCRERGPFLPAQVGPCGPVGRGSRNGRARTARLLGQECVQQTVVGRRVLLDHLPEQGGTG